MTTRRVVSLLAALAAAAALAACGGSSSSKSSDRATARAFCDALVQSVYTKAVHCGGGSIIPRIYIEVMFDCLGFQEAQDAKRITYDGGRSKACLDALDAATCVEAEQYFGGSTLLGLYKRLPDACQAAVKPAVASGGDCFSLLGIECIGGYCNIESPEQCLAGGATCTAYLATGANCASGLCAPGYHCEMTCVADPAISVLQAGGDCSVADTVCADGLYCDGTSHCVARKAAPSACTGDRECLEGLDCKSNVCTAPLQVGATCAGGDCATGLYCNGSAVCAAYPGLGASCAAPPSGDEVLCVDSWCDSASMEPTCKPYLDPGSACDPGDMLRMLTECGPGHLCYPVGLDSGTLGVCGRIYCASFG